jgi:hypothetical protein
MAVYTTTRAAAGRPSAASGWAQDIKTAWGTFEWGATGVPAAADTIIMCKLPKGALILGGRVTGDALEDTSVGSGLLSINIGLDKAVVTPAGTTVSASSTSNALASNWVLGSDVLALQSGISLGSKRNIPLGSLLFSEGPLLTTDETNAYVTVGASTFRLTTGTFNLYIDYYQAQHS